MEQLFYVHNVIDQKFLIPSTSSHALISCDDFEKERGARVK